MRRIAANRDQRVVNLRDVAGVRLPVFGPPELAGTAARVLRADAVAVLPHALPRHRVPQTRLGARGHRRRPARRAGPHRRRRPAHPHPPGRRPAAAARRAARVHRRPPRRQGRLSTGSSPRSRCSLLLAAAGRASPSLIRLDSPGPALFRQVARRPGRRGVHACCKFRTMRVDAEQLLADLRDAQRGRRPAVQDARRPAHHPRRRVPAPLLPRRAAAAVQRRCAATCRSSGRGRRCRARSTRYDVDVAPPAAGQARHHRPVAGQRPLRPVLGGDASGSTSTTSRTGRRCWTSRSCGGRSTPSGRHAGPTETVEISGSAHA